MAQRGEREERINAEFAEDAEKRKQIPLCGQQRALASLRNDTVREVEWEILRGKRRLQTEGAEEGDGGHGEEGGLKPPLH